MLTITYNDGSVYSVVNIRNPEDFAKIPDTKGIKEIYVDGDEMAMFFGMEVNTHGARGITLTGKGMETLLGYHLSKALNKQDAEDERAAKGLLPWDEEDWGLALSDESPAPDSGLGLEADAESVQVWREAMTFDDGDVEEAASSDKFKIVVLCPRQSDPTWDMADAAEIWEVQYRSGDMPWNTVHDFIIHSKSPLKVE